MRSFVQAYLGLPAAPGVGSGQGSVGWEGVPLAGWPLSSGPAAPQSLSGPSEPP